MSPQNDGAEPAGASPAAADTGVPKVRQAFALPEPVAAPTAELAPAVARAAAATEGRTGTTGGTGADSGTGTGMDSGTGTGMDSGTGTRGPETAVGTSRTGPESAPAPALAPAPAPTPDPGADADVDPALDPDTDPGADVPAAAAAAAPAREPVSVPVAAVRSGEQSAGTAAQTASGRPKKSVLAAAAVAGVVLVSVPFLLLGPDRDRSAPAAAVGPTDGTVLGAGASEPPGQYAAGSSSPSPSPSSSPSAESASPDKDGKGDEKEEKDEKGNDGGAAGAAGEKTRTPTGSDGKKDEPAAGGKPAGAPVTVAGDALVSKASGKCLSAGRGTDGTQLTLRTCNGSAEQHWDFRSDGTIRSKGLCMDVAWASKEDGTVIQVAWCSGNPAQQFHLNGAGDLIAGIADKCVDVLDAGTADGTPVQLWSCAGSAHQKWYRS
ncbi:hypothetical protein GCM10010358_46250 [Streptomyces minutiscleroticus]|uniref:Ricin B lectin domain-containing protein n=1 Tax=Streptomyces minutiscleroticus TaxID=68238 RepID=A0A918U382_9ACTN|nr:RICIN domain-containing protein [Streptomyces minutiscleroticus]GGX86948.1 hypothetical protein GCM10010358_46250 [Streptomyces minutiscleroticus]